MTSTEKTVLQTFTTCEERNMSFIIVQEEYGYRHWIGAVPNDMTIEKITEWWKSLDSLQNMFFNPNGNFIVPLNELEDVTSEDSITATWSWTNEQGEKQILNRDTVIAFFHVHENDDSYMKIVNGEYIYHSGHDNNRIDATDFNPLDLEEIQSLKEIDPKTFQTMTAEYNKKVNNLAINWLMRSVDLQVSSDKDTVFSNQSTNNPLLINLATHLRDENILETFYSEDPDVLDQWPLSISSYAMSLIPEPESIMTLVEDYKVTEEDFNIKLDIEIAKNIVKKVQDFAINNQENLSRIFCYEEARNDTWIKFQ